jgi:AraC-like DNA-binding protein
MVERDVFDITVADGLCPTTSPRWLTASRPCDYRILFVRSGAFLIRLNGVEAVADNSSLIVLSSSDDLLVAHPFGADHCTYVELGPEWEDRLTTGQFAVHDQLDLGLRRMATALHRGTDATSLADQLNLSLQLLPDRDTAPRDPRAHRKVVQSVMMLFQSGGYRLTLPEVAKHVNVSQHHLSRMFHAATGHTITEYRNRSRVRAVLNDMQEGDRHIGELAARYDFADQSHLVRVMRRYLGVAPAEIRRQLSIDVQETGHPAAV